MTTGFKTIIAIGQQAVGLEEHEPGYLLGTVNILGVDHHVELIQVEDDPDPEALFRQRAVRNEDEENNNGERYEWLIGPSSGEPVETVEVDGREFAVLVTPYAR